VHLIVARLGGLGSWLAGASLVLMTLLGAADIVGTKFFNYPIPGTFEATEALMVLTVFLSLAHVQARRDHIAIDLVVSRLSANARRALELGARLLTLGVFAVMGWQGWALGLASVRDREYASGIVQFPVYPSKLALAVGVTLLVLQALLDVVGALRGDAGRA
jgi:TRAP-type C4-dicarboxylate transport system permease small subunit